MGKIQEALRKAEEARAQNVDAGRGDAASGAAVPASATSFALSAALRAGEIDPHVVALAEPRSQQAEQYRALRGNLLSLASKETKVVVVTSAVAGEGRTVTALNLACMLAEDAGKRVVVVDADLRKPSLHKLLGIDNQRGLADYLGGGTMLEMVVQRSRLPNLWAMTSGRTPPNPAELLGGKRMDDIVARLRRDYDHVVLDTPAVLANGDAAAIAPRADATLLCVRMESTQREASRKALDVLKKAHAHVVGTVLTAVGAGA
jgi:capsular exopolysaccharide synthesis family protein